jgi:chromosome segregation ATPase
VADRLDSALKEQLRTVLDGRAVTEAQLRKLADEGRSRALVLGSQLERAERRLDELSADPASPLTEIAGTLRAVNELRPDLDELEQMLTDLHERARRARALWLAPR